MVTFTIERRGENLHIHEGVQNLTHLCMQVEMEEKEVEALKDKAQHEINAILCLAVKNTINQQMAWTQEK